ncbi:hypothetical protein ACLB1R_03195 [Escherichia coli]
MRRQFCLRWLNAVAVDKAHLDVLFQHARLLFIAAANIQAATVIK